LVTSTADKQFPVYSVFKQYVCYRHFSCINSYHYISTNNQLQMTTNTNVTVIKEKPIVN